MSDEEEFIEVVVNGRRTTVTKDTMTYTEVALLAGALPDDEGLTITYTRPPVDNHGVSGTLRPGHSIDIEPKMIFDAVRASRA